ncbi:YceI family protein [Microbacterium horticulturae]|uniref:YceI family protein n=1 Tax=Microbacterium horticulturae TaxID=3028316 RepID=A0ABY8C138_9MICO|nr:YceI family protein [Microbacterium sp. KACC 23027]WEG08761.1 YceI family protein [Microbacterium sp. KACC 23027]
MKRRTAIALITAGAVVVVGAVVALAGPVFYRDVIVGAPDPTPTVATGATAGATVEPAEVQGAWTVSDGSYAGYRVDEVLNGTDVTVDGRTEKVTGTVTIDDAAVTAASFTVDVDSIATDQGSRDSYFRNTALQTFRYPTATFTLTKPVAAASSPQVGVKQTVTATGELTLHGQTRTVSVPMDLLFDGETAQVAGSIPITFADYGVQAPNLGFVKVEDHGFVEFSLVLTEK